jgi:hypothetical protein
MSPDPATVLATGQADAGGEAKTIFFGRREKA